MDNTEKASKFIGHLINEGLLNLDMEQTKQTVSVLSAILNHAEKTAINDYVTLTKLTGDITKQKPNQGT